MNPLTLNTTPGSTGTLSEGNLKWLGTGANDNVFATHAANSSKYYYEVYVISNYANLVVGWTTTDATTKQTTALAWYESACVRWVIKPCFGC